MTRIVALTSVALLFSLEFCDESGIHTGPHFCLGIISESQCPISHKITFVWSGAILSGARHGYLLVATNTLTILLPSNFCSQTFV